MYIKNTDSLPSHIQLSGSFFLAELNKGQEGQDVVWHGIEANCIVL